MKTTISSVAQIALMLIAAKAITALASATNLPTGNVSEYWGGANGTNRYQNPSRTTTASTTSTTSTTSISTPTPTYTNIVANGDFENGNAPWQVANNPRYSPLNLISDGSVTTPYAESGTHAYQIRDSGYEDTGNRSLCLQQTFYHPHTATYQLSFYYGRQANPAPGAITTKDQIEMWLYVDGNLIVMLNVCNPTLGTCAVTLPSAGWGTQGGYDLFRGLLNATEGYHTVKLCAVYSSTKRGTQDHFLVDKVIAFQVSS